jgi:hypothetical protein
MHLLRMQVKHPPVDFENLRDKWGSKYLCVIYKLFPANLLSIIFYALTIKTPDYPII